MLVSRYTTLAFALSLAGLTSAAADVVNRESFGTDHARAKVRKRKTPSMRISQIVLRLGVCMTPSLTLAAQAGYDVTVLQGATHESG